MYRFLKYLVPIIVTGMVVAVVAVTAVAGPAKAPESQIEEPQPVVQDVPPMVNYQGFLTDDQGDPMDGTVNLQFGLFAEMAGGSALWTNTYNGVVVDEGYFAVQLGPFMAADFELPPGKTTLYVEVSILPDGGGSVALPRQPSASAPYAFLAQEASEAPWDGLSGVPPGFADNIDDVEFENIVTVAKSGAKFSSVQAAIDSITDAGPLNRYLVWIGPGRYEEQVVTKAHVHLAGAGRWLTWIESGVSNEDIYPPEDGTLQLANFVNLSDLTVQNYGEGYRNVAILAGDGAQANALLNVSALTDGPGEINYGIFLHGPNTAVDLQGVNSYVFGSAFVGVALEVAGGADAWVQGGRYNAFNGVIAVGIASAEPESRLDLFDVDVEAGDTDWASIGLQVGQEAVANVYGGSFEARNAITETFGILVRDGGIMEASGPMAYGHGSPSFNQGLSVNGGWAILHSGTYNGFGGEEAYGIIATAGATLEANGVKASGQYATGRNDGLRNESGAVSTLNGGTFIGEGGGDNRGVASYDDGSVLDVQHATIRGVGSETPGVLSFGLSNEADSAAYVSHSEMWGNSNALLANGGITEVHLSRFVQGFVGGGGPAMCLAVTTDFAFYADSCPVVVPDE